MNGNSKHAKSCPQSHCGCCGPVEYDFPEEFLTPKLRKLKETMSEEEFKKLMQEFM
ncbi:MAG: hypothetical protein Q8P95_00430 [bacterium]|nr:hypothetical protein [bacterium]